MKTALVAGATGLVGLHLVEELIKNNQYKKVLVLSRRKMNIKHPKLENRIIDFDKLETLKVAGKIDDCFCALGTTVKKAGKEGQLKVDYHYVLNLAKWCSAHRVRRFLVVSSQGASHKSPFFYMRTKGQMEEAVKKSGVESIYIVRPSLITGKREESRLAEEMGYYLYKAFSPLMIGKLRKMRPIAASQIARCMMVLARRKEKEILTIESDEIQAY